MQEEFSSNTPLFRLIFSNIKCNIKLQNSSLLLLAIKIGKNYSLPTSKIQLINGYLQFPDSITIPITQDLVYDTSPRKQKCEVMLYKHPHDHNAKPQQLKKLNDTSINKKEKEKKNLIGMASLTISTQLFTQKLKTFRITNTFDKDATITCNIKISHDIFQTNESRISSIGQKSQTSSIQKLNNFQQDKMQKGDSQIVKIQKQLNSKYKKSRVPELNISRMSEQNKPISTKQVGSYSQRHMVQNYQESELNKTEKLFGIKQEIFSGKIKRNDKNGQSYSERFESKNSNQDDQSQDIFQLCNNLQQQNTLLMSKIQNLQNHILSKNPPNESTHFDQSKLNKSQSLLKPSMIKKNNTFTTSASTWATKTSDLKSISSMLQKPQKKDSGSQSPKILPNQSNFSFKPPVRMISIKQIDIQHESSKVITPRSQFAQKMSYGLNQNSQASHFQNFQAKEIRRNPPMRIDSVVSLAYVPPIQSTQRQFSDSSKSRIDRIDKSVSEIQKSFSKSYTKFNSVKKHYIEGNQSKYSILRQVEKREYGLQTEIEEVAQIPRIVASQSQLNSPMFVTVNGLASQVNNSKVKSQSPTKKNPQQNQMNFSRYTLQDLNQIIQQKYRKTQKYLKQANQQLHQQNSSLKKEKKLLQAQIEQKKDLSVDQFMKLQQKNEANQKEIQYYMEQATKKDGQITKLVSKLQEAHKQNENLHKNLREQKKTVAYFIKTSHFHDEKQKQLEMKLKFIEQQFNYQDSSLRSDSNNSKSHIVMPSPKVILHSARKMPDAYSSHIIRNDNSGLTPDRHSHQNGSMSQHVPSLRLSVTKMAQNQQKQPEKITPFSKLPIPTQKQRNIESKGLQSLKKHTAVHSNHSKSMIEQSGIFSKMFDNYKRSDQNTNLNSNPKQSLFEKRNLTINTKI